MDANLKLFTINLETFIGKSQMSVLKRNIRGEEGAFFKEMLKGIKQTILNMPGPYETEGRWLEKKAMLHYFKGGSDFYIFERDNFDDKQKQAFGFACLNNDKLNSELGYINISELIACNVELDLYYTPLTLEEILEKFKA